MTMRRAFLVLVALLLLYEAVALGTITRGDTISEIVWAASHRPLVPFAMGFLMGHFFWQRKVE